MRVKLPSVGFVGTRRALALAPLGFVWTSFLVLGLLSPPEHRAMFLGLAATYGVAFIAVGAGYFWGRWFANGLGWNGAWALLAVRQVDDPRPLLLWAGIHVSVLLLLAGEQMSALYEGRQDWRARFGVKDENVGRIGGLVTTVASLLPMLVTQLLGRSPDAADLFVLTGAVAGFALLLRMRTAGVLLLALCGPLALLVGGPVRFGEVALPMLSPVVAVGLALPLVLLAPAIARYLRRAA